jgi:hypothetical protein
MLGAVGSVPLMHETEIPRPILGYNTAFEKEADELAALYFDIYNENRVSLNSLIRKLQFNEMSERFHPDMQARENLDLKARIKTVENAKFLYFGKEKSFITKDAGTIPYQLKFLYQSALEKKIISNFFSNAETLLSFCI